MSVEYSLEIFKLKYIKCIIFLWIEVHAQQGYVFNGLPNLHLGINDIALETLAKTVHLTFSGM